LTENLKELSKMQLVPFLVGPTGVGKTEISIQIAQNISVEIISADSRQIYKFLNIGTAKPPPEILMKIPHHFIDYLSPDEYFSAGMYGREARSIINQILERKVIPLVVGGSGFYIQALIDGLSEIDISDHTIREDLGQRLENEGVEVLHKELKSVDPDLAKKIKMKDRQRITRGLEVYYATGKPLSKLQLNKPNPANFKPILIGLEAERKFLYHKINSRVDEMIQNGLVDEIRQLRDKGLSEKDNALNTVGYKEVFDYLNNIIEFDEMVEKIKINSRRYAKRQLTWFKRDNRITWMKIDEYDAIENIVNDILENYKKFKLI
jgi:tRNA dimethylallyltransferase